MSLIERNFDSLINLILAYFDCAALAHTWSDLARVCRRWACVVARFDLAQLSPRQLYYNAAAVARHNIAPPAEVWFMLPQNLIPWREHRTTAEGLEFDDPSATVSADTKMLQLGWSSGAEAARVMLSRWRPLWMKSVQRIWRFNGAFAALRVLLNYRGAYNSNITCIREEFHYARQNSSYMNAKRYNCLAILRRNVTSGFFMRHGQIAPAQIYLTQIIAERDIYHRLDRNTICAVADGLCAETFNLALSEIVQDLHDPPVQLPPPLVEKWEILYILLESNNARPRYEPLHLVLNARLQYVRTILAKMIPMREVAEPAPHPFELHIPALCNECRIYHYRQWV